MKNKRNVSFAITMLVLVFSFSLYAQPERCRNNNDERSERFYRNTPNNHYDMYADRSNGRDKDRDSRYYTLENDLDNRSYVIRRRPGAPFVSRVQRPSPYHVWVGGEYYFTGGQYVGGSWVRTRGGWYWVPGYWTKLNRW